MGYTTYAFYTSDDYGGDTIAESSFTKWNNKASDQLDFITNGNIDSQVLADEVLHKKIEKCTCELADLLFRINEENQKAKTESVVKSMSSGNESITYGSIATTVSVVLADQKAQKKLFYDTVKDYLSGTGLLYEGLD